MGYNDNCCLPQSQTFEQQMWQKMCHLEMLFNQWGRYTHPNPTTPGSGKGLYELWLEAGNIGTPQDFLNSLIGKDIYQLWLDQGNTGSFESFLDRLKGDPGNDGLSAYGIWQQTNPGGSEYQFLASLIGPPGPAGSSAYDSWKNLGNVGSEADFVLSLRGRDGAPGTGGSKQKAIYLDDYIVANSNNHTQAFIDAISQLTLTYSKLIVRQGEYVVDVNKILGKPRITIEFEAGAKIRGTGPGYMFDLNNCPDVVVEGGLYTGPDPRTVAFRSRNGSTNTYFSNCQCQGASLHRPESDRPRYYLCQGDAPTANLEFAWPAFVDGFFANDGLALYCNVEGYSHGFQYWGGDCNPIVDATTGARSSIKLTDAQGNKINRPMKRWRYVGCRVNGCLGGGIWGSMGDDIQARYCKVTNTGDVGIDFEGSVNCEAYKCIVRDCKNGGLTTFYACDDIRFIGCESYASTKDFKTFGVWSVEARISGKLTISDCLFRGESKKMTTAGYEGGSYREIIVNKHTRFENVNFKLHEVGGWKQTFEDVTFTNTTEEDYELLSLGSGTDYKNLPPEVMMKNVTIINQTAVDQNRVGGYAFFIYPLSSVVGQPKVTLENVKTAGYDLDAIIKSQVGFVASNRKTKVMLRRNNWGHRNVFFEPEIGGLINLDISEQDNTSGEDNVPFGAGVQSKSELTLDMRLALAGDPVMVHDTKTVKPGIIDNNGKLIPLRMFREVTAEDNMSDVWFYLGTLSGSQVPNNRQSLSFSVRASLFLHATKEFTHNVTIGTRDALTVNHQLYGLTTLDGRCANVEIYNIAGVNVDSADNAYEVYLRVGAGYNAVRIAMTEFVEPNQTKNFLSKRTSVPTGTVVFNSQNSNNAPQLWVPSNGSVQIGNGGGNGGDLSNYYNKTQTDNLVGVKANTAQGGDINAAKAVSVVGTVVLVTVAGDSENLYYKLPNGILKKVATIEVPN